MTVHTIFVPSGFSVEQVWEMIRRSERVPLVDGEATEGVWVTVDGNGKILG